LRVEFFDVFGGRFALHFRKDRTVELFFQQGATDIRFEVEAKDIQKLQLRDGKLYYLYYEGVSYGKSNEEISKIGDEFVVKFFEEKLH